ncbi:flagellar basal body protein FliL [Novimethylophilus kurashikiensis]|uniref:Flagellar basal body protein FliL n=1 Tax=Novimethylophilus kurashikiensis TaxID=1825523 RepID=A0A2R5F886_9PROT|nr:hypothetical protein [Novimethylophilus kurashikiensis]GBG14460.1 flagellar basal body protein FliL [Novimethylophilus kurashikiensis]
MNRKIVSDLGVTGFSERVLLELAKPVAIGDAPVVPMANLLAVVENDPETLRDALVDLKQGKVLPGAGKVQVLDYFAVAQVEQQVFYKLSDRFIAAAAL